MTVRVIEVPDTGKTIFVLTVLYLNPGVGSEAPHTAIEHQRTWGWFSNLEDAEHAVLVNDTDMYECGYYNAAVVEEMQEGTIAHAVAEHWYRARWDEATDTYVVTRAEKPPWLADVVSFGMG